MAKLDSVSKEGVFVSLCYQEAVQKYAGEGYHGGINARRNCFAVVVLDLCRGCFAGVGNWPKHAAPGSKMRRETLRASTPAQVRPLMHDGESYSLLRPLVRVKYETCNWMANTHLRMRISSRPYREEFTMSNLTLHVRIGLQNGAPPHSNKQQFLFHFLEHLKNE